MKKQEPTKTEVALTVAATIAAINLRKIQHEYERLAAKHDIVPDPNMEPCVVSCIEAIQTALSKNPRLADISFNIVTRVHTMQ